MITDIILLGGGEEQETVSGLQYRYTVCSPCLGVFSGMYLYTHESDRFHTAAEWGCVPSHLEDVSHFLKRFSCK